MLMAWNRTKIVCTLGPATDAPGVLEELVRSGMSVARVNLSHGERGEHERRIAEVREIARRLGEPIAVLADLPGPKFRLGILPEGMRRLADGAQVILAAQPGPAPVLPVLNALGKALLNGGMNDTEMRSHFAMWAMLSAPLIMGTDVPGMKPEIRAILTNRRLVAIDQDPLGLQGFAWIRSPELELWARPLATVLNLFTSFGYFDREADHGVAVLAQPHQPRADAPRDARRLRRSHARFGHLHGRRRQASAGPGAPI